MRRFWAHIILVLTALLMMGSTFVAIFTRASMNLEYTEGSEVTYRIFDREDDSYVFTDDTGVKEIAEEMRGRLDNSGVTDYNIKTVGYDTIKVQFAEPNNLNKSNIVAYLGFNGSLALSNMDDEKHYNHITADEFLISGKKAYLDSINNYPTVVIPVDTNNPAYEDLIEQTKTQKEEGIGETSSTGEKDENGEEKTTTTTYLYLWYDFDEKNDRYSKTVETNEDYDVNVARKIIMKFNIENLYYPDNQDNKLAASLNLDADGDETITTTEVRNAYNNARFYVNLLNSNVLKYKVTCINNQQIKFVPASTESLINNADPHQYVAMSRTFIATIVAVVIVSLICLVFFKLSTPSIIVTTLLSIFASIGFIVVMNAEFNIGAVIALTAITIASLASNILYASRLKEEIYKGRTVKKANSEASRRSLMPSVDIHIVLILLGIFVYIFGGSLMRTFALISVVGGLSSLLINLIAFRGLMWLITNNTAFNDKQQYFGIIRNKLPVVVKGEESKIKPYKGEFVNVNFSKHHRAGFFCACTLFVASLAGLITFGVINNNQPLNSPAEAKTSQLYVYSTDELESTDSINNNLLKQIIIYESAEATTGKTLDEYVKNVATYTHTETENAVQKDTYYFEYDLNALIDENTLATAGYIPGSYKIKLSEALEGYERTKTSASIKVVTPAYENQANFGGIALGTGVALLVAALYFILRFKLSRGLTGFILTSIVTVIGFGLFSLTRIPLPTVSSVVMPLIALFGAVIAIYIMAKDKELVADDKARVIDYARRGEIIKEAVGISFNEILAIGAIMVYIAVNFAAFGPTAPSLIYVILIVASLFSLIIMLNLFVPVAQKIYQFVSPVENRKHKKKRKANKNVVSATHKSSEPEEAVFIGIND